MEVKFGVSIHHNHVCNFTLIKKLILNCGEYASIRLKNTTHLLHTERTIH
jgi:hypothetical protein